MTQPNAVQRSLIETIANRATDLPDGSLAAVFEAIILDLDRRSALEPAVAGLKAEAHGALIRATEIDER